VPSSAYPTFQFIQSQFDAYNVYDA